MNHVTEARAILTGRWLESIPILTYTHLSDFRFLSVVFYSSFWSAEGLNGCQCDNNVNRNKLGSSFSSVIQRISCGIQGQFNRRVAWLWFCHEITRLVLWCTIVIELKDQKDYLGLPSQVYMSSCFSLLAFCLDARQSFSLNGFAKYICVFHRFMHKTSH